LPESPTTFQLFSTLDGAVVAESLMLTGYDNCWMSIKLRDIKTRVIKEKDGSYAIACSALGVYSVGETLTEAKKNFAEALELHLSALKEKAIQAVA
jgi:predicted RNase H-like HicB family nuclease